MPEVSIIIRTKNEERWIGHCLEMVFKQDFKDIEVILVDNASTDHTVEVAKRYPLARLINIEKFVPGNALNQGIRASTGKYIVCLSAHCVPKETNWLSVLLANFVNDPNLAGVYGRQLPVSFTDPVDKRDLLIVFGQDRRVQVKDYFFHNANSMLRRETWDRFPFDEEVTNIEDRVWGKTVTGAGLHIVYDPDAAVYHYHGLHQGNTPARAKGVVSIIEKVDADVVNELPDSLKPEHANIVAVVPILGRIESGSLQHKLLTQTISALSKARYVDNIYVVSHQSELAGGESIWINRADIPNADTIGMDELLQQVLSMIESRKDHPEALLYVNYEYLSRPAGLFDELIFDAQYEGYDTVFPGYVDFGHYWFRAENEQFKQTDPSMKGRAEREPVFRALYGLGCVTSAVQVRKCKMVGGKIGILPIQDLQHTLRVKEMDDLVLAALLGDNVPEMS
ncbi:MAG: glycosyl transferase family 2 [Gallionellales bacterium 35-53-114]|jgi:glycosyltransferase involved in cell wall biosynthesis|nr:MAG: glycosyl transferase family 2 [Gallionellales bacterium 35-53-114]OYZ63466.1 MAG: glycosyl transferase family 2 [Gallionellales bacterium 24-53-125]OZB10921.1 MAG: glycosyl transferase family 2 [Gallionellales bacterium 39-52-133]HQS58897.1 glycosyltransferase family A protein [Gallionellaceae bacterium]HQS75718.1 glycosyltransferase family A protein [Gallionellaceae bacterium]